MAELYVVNVAHSTPVCLQELVRGGKPWVVMCTDMQDNEIGATLATNSV